MKLKISPTTLALALFFSFIVVPALYAADWSRVPSWNPGDGVDSIKVVSAIEEDRNLVIAETRDSLGNYYPDVLLYTINNDGDKLSGPFTYGGYWTARAYDGFSEYDSSSGKHIFNVFGYEYISYSVKQATFFRVYEDGTYVLNGSNKNWHHFFNPEGEEFVDASSGYYAGGKLSNGNYLAVGEIKMPNADNTSYNPLVVCFSSSGEVLWFLVLDGSEVSQVFDNYDKGVDFVEHNGFIYVLIDSRSEGPGTEYNNHAYKIVKLNMSDGSYLDSETFGYYDNDLPVKILVYENDFIVYGYAKRDIPDFHIFIDRINPDSLEELPTYPYLFDSFNGSYGHYANDMLINEGIVHMTGSMVDQETDRRLFHMGFNLETKELVYYKLVGEQAEGENIDYRGISLLMTSDGDILVGGSRCDANENQWDYFLSYLDLSLLKETQAISLNAGWNLVSLYVQPGDTAIAEVLADILPSCEKVWRLVDGAWRLYDPNDPFFSDLEKLAAGQSFMVKMAAAATLSVNGFRSDSGQALASGWEMPGYLSDITRPCGEALAAISGDYDKVWGMADGTWQLYDPDDPAASDLLEMGPGRGFMIKINNNCTWVLP